MTRYYFSAIMLFCLSMVYAQPRTGNFINPSIGLGVVASTDDSELSGTGFYAQAEYVWAPKSWFGIRPYAGLIIASEETNEDGLREYIKSNAAMLGAKVRLAAPIPYVAPFIEVGVGLSLGSFETNTQFTHIKKSGALVHIPFTIGLALGRNHATDIKFTYYYHNDVDQFSGAAAVGFSFPLD